jgi:hypothetical protein
LSLYCWRIPCIWKILEASRLFPTAGGFTVLMLSRIF